MATQQTAVTQFVDASGVRYAYRTLGPSSSTPPVMHIHFRASMDFWNPALINALAARRPVIIFDNAGVGKNSGEIPPTYSDIPGLGRQCNYVCRGAREQADRSTRFLDGWVLRANSSSYSTMAGSEVDPRRDESKPKANDGYKLYASWAACFPVLI